MKIADIVYDATNAYDGIAVEIYISGCYRKCFNCHNPELQDFSVGEDLDTLELITDLSVHSKWFDIISFLGGDLLCQDDYKAKELIKDVRANFPKKHLYLFTGAELDEIPMWCFKYFDTIKYGKYVEELKQEGFPSSSNQKVIKKGVDYN